jgi:uncharacterized protein (UPF0335 family)
MEIDWIKSINAMDLQCALIVGGVSIFLTALGYGYKIHADRRHIKLEKQDKEQHKESCRRIGKLEEKNGHEQHQIDNLNEKVEKLEKLLNGRRTPDQK